MAWPGMSLRKAKKKLKTYLRLRGIKIIRTNGRLFVFCSDHNTRNIHCTRYYSFAAAREDHPQLDSLIAEHRLPVKLHWAYVYHSFRIYRGLD